MIDFVGAPDTTNPFDPRLLALRVELLVSFTVLARERHFTRAARTLYVSQPGLSRRIAALERCLGTAVIDRTTHGVELTAAGRELLPHATAILESVHRAVGAIRCAAPEQFRSVGEDLRVPSVARHR